MEEEGMDSEKTWNDAPHYEFCLRFIAVRNFQWGSEIYRGLMWREKDETGRDTGVNGYLIAPGDEGMIWCRADSMDEFADKIKKILEMRYDMYVHFDPGLAVRIAEEKFFLC
ncbi:MAG: hypothetical protein JXN62_13300 [Bacteroidales bacterium]|nr:hypothetical protein [Bacteroidales bacterium]